MLLSIRDSSWAESKNTIELWARQPCFSWSFGVGNRDHHIEYEKEQIMGLFRQVSIYTLTIGWLAAAGTSLGSAAPLHEVCKADIDHYCDTATTGNGHIMACLYAHEDKISSDCDAATDDVSDILDTVFATVQDVLSQCAADIKEHCTNVEFGGGRIISCLVSKSSSLTPDCKSAVPQFADDVAD